MMRGRRVCVMWFVNVVADVGATEGVEVEVGGP